MFLSVEWAKRWLPAVLLLLSLFLPWWTMIYVFEIPSRIPDVRPASGYSLGLSFPWEEMVVFDYAEGVRYGGENGELRVDYVVSFRDIPYFCFVSALILVGGLCGLSDKSKIRTLGGLLGIAGVVSYLIFVFPKSISPWISWNTKEMRNFPYFGSAPQLWWFISAGFYLALAGSLMLLFPLIRTLVERLRKRL